MPYAVEARTGVLIHDELAEYLNQQRTQGWKLISVIFQPAERADPARGFDGQPSVTFLFWDVPDGTAVT